MGVAWGFAAIAAVMAVAAALLTWPPRGVASAVAATDARDWTARGLAARLALPLAATLLYLWLGDPAALNPRRTELSLALRSTDGPLDSATARQSEAELQHHLSRHPDDARARVMQARLDLRAQRYAQAAEQFARALAGPSKTARDAGVWVEFAEAQGLAQGGTLAGRPRELVANALAIDPTYPPALDLAGSAAWEAGDYALTVTYWRQLLTQIPSTDPRHAQLQAGIARAEQRARFALPGSR